MAKYKVVYNTEIEADCRADAARKALDNLREDGMGIFIVQRENSKRIFEIIIDCRCTITEITDYKPLIK